MEIPFTLQTFAVLLVLFTIGGKRGTIAIVVYILLGLVGVPVFAGFKSGPAALVGPTGGFIVGFVAAGLIFWAFDSLLYEKFKRTTTLRICFRVLEGLLVEIVLYTIGVTWFMLVYTRNTGDIGIGSVLSLCVLPFIIPDAVKLVMAAVTSLRTKTIVKQ